LDLAAPYAETSLPVTAKLRVGIVGLGAMGSSAAFHLAQRGAEVVGFDGYGPAHDRGSSHGESRIIRQAYYEDPCYVPLVLDSYRLWRELEVLSGESLLRVTGGLMIGLSDGEVVRGALESARQWGLPHRVLGSAEVRSEFPAFQLLADEVAVFEPEAGVLAPELAILSHLRQAALHGAQLHFGEPVERWDHAHGQVRVSTSTSTYAVDRLVLAAGAWTPRLLQDWALPLMVERQVQAWFTPHSPGLFSPSRFPIYLHEEEAGSAFYGFPSLDGSTVKAAQHHGGEEISPDEPRRELHKEEALMVLEHVGRLIPGLKGAGLARTKVCMYTDTPDFNFAIGLHPACELVSVACGFSGHGFKFSPVIGEILADLAESGATGHPIGPLSPLRFGSEGA
jgi:sarcosine oxidase